MKTSENISSSSRFFLIGVLISGLTAVFVRLFQLSKTQSRQNPPEQTSFGQISEVSKTPGVEAQVKKPSSIAIPATKELSSKPAVPVQASTRWSVPTKYIVGIGLFLAFLILVLLSRSVIPLLIFAVLLAFIIQPIIRFFNQKLKFRHGLAVAACYVLVIGILLLIPLIVIPTIVDAFNSIISYDYQAIAENVIIWLEGIQSGSESIPLVGSIIQSFIDSLIGLINGLVSGQATESVSYQLTVESIGAQIGSTIGTLARLLGPIISTITSLGFMLIISLYISLSGEQYGGWYKKLIPSAYYLEIADLIDRIRNIWGAFLRGQLTLMLLIGTVVWLGNTILGTPYPLLLGIISGTMELIPSLGPLLALIPAIFLSLLFGSSHFALSNLAFAIIVLIFYLLVQFLENQVVVPYVLGDAVDLPPLVVITGVLVGGTIAGILGIFLATPMIATGREIFGYLYDKILEPPPEPPPPEQGPSLWERAQGLIRRVRIPLPKLRRNRDKQPDIATAMPEPNEQMINPG